MATVNVYKGKRGKTSYQLTFYSGYIVGEDGTKRQKKDTVTKTLEDMNICAVSEKGNPRSESSILKEVQLYADNYEKKLEGAKYTRGDKVRFETFYRETWKPYAKEHLAASSYYSYTMHIEEIFLPEIGSLKLGNISTARLSALYIKLMNNGARLDGKADKGYSLGSIKTFHKHLSSVMRFALDNRYIEVSPCVGIKYPKNREESAEEEAEEKLNYFEKEEVEIFLDMIEHPSPCVVTAFYENWGKSKTTTYDFCAREMTAMQYDTYKVLFRTALASGARIGELCALTWKDIDFDACKLHITKAVGYAKSKGGSYIKSTKTKNSKRTITIPSGEIERLKALRETQKETILKLGTAWEGVMDLDRIDENLVFPQYCGKIMWRSAPNRILHRLIKNYNVEAPTDKQIKQITIHGLRHTSATLLLAGGMNIKDVSSRLGHKNIQTTMNIYAHYLKSSDEKASAVLEKALNFGISGL